jgi:FAD/FMN-containing dehydrogenase/Fe-S oxidoreductase
LSEKAGLRIADFGFPVFCYFRAFKKDHWMKTFISRLNTLGDNLDGELKHDLIYRTIYSTDASVYKEMPVAVIWPKNKEDIKKVLSFASREKVAVTVRAAGTSLAGQVVTSGIVVDISKYLNKILEVNVAEKWVKVEPGVVLDELNLKLKEHGLFFGPETSTSNRCNLGGMVGNNACGLHSVIYKSTRDHTIELNTILSDGSEAIFGAVDKKTFELKCQSETLEGKIYRNIRKILSNPENIKSILTEFPDPSIPRRNTGYALDILLNSNIFSDESDKNFNFTNLLAGSEGTLAITTEIKLNLVTLPPVYKALVCVHLNKRNDSFKANLITLKYGPSAVEMMDDRILNLTEGNISQRNNRFFLEGKPGAIVIVEFVKESNELLEGTIAGMINELKEKGFGYAYPVVKGKDIPKVWELRKAGLGVLSNMKGDAKPVSLIEDTAVGVSSLPDYMEDFERMLSSYGKDSVYHAHIGTGELHIRPLLNLKDEKDVQLFRTLGLETAKLVKKYRGSMSGEHGDGRLRGEFLPIVIGEKNCELLKEIKLSWDPENILNPGKIIDTRPMNTFLRYSPGQVTPSLETFYDFSGTDGIIRAAENCNGSGDCRKSEIIGGLMCPSFMATRDEKHSTRGRANILREFLSKEAQDRWDHKEIYEALELCLACKGCKSECPSSVDIAKMKSEFLQHWNVKHGISLRTRLIAYIHIINKIGSFFPPLFNFFAGNNFLSSLFKRISGIAQNRSIPLIYNTTLRKWIKNNLAGINPKTPKGRVCLFIDEFTDYNDTETGIKAIKLLTSLNYEVITVRNEVSARTFISKGLLRKAKKTIRKNILIFSKIIDKNLPLVGIEPSGILGFRDEYPDLAGSDLREAAIKLSENCYLIDEFISKEFRAGRIKQDDFTNEGKELLLHTHCQQKAIASSASAIEALSIPEYYNVREIRSGCCGMAGSFGYEKEHYELSNKIGELILFPEIRSSNENTVIVAPGTSCRHHIKDGTGKNAVHPAVVLYEALRRK